MTAHSSARLTPCTLELIHLSPSSGNAYYMRRQLLLGPTAAVVFSLVHEATPCRLCPSSTGELFVTNDAAVALVSFIVYHDPLDMLHHVNFRYQYIISSACAFPMIRRREKGLLLVRVFKCCVV